ncbi:MAG: prepilin-type N-terminal cleavage/methylation domain-containing protein [Azoarcus sp.]|jgi:prepilin-type N-terminal cleavage/methylation domain-containing protein|nr:prepilin-type N-terminal cleavage/methylation domain-containing protein [Azoarcus sp.]
MKDAFSPVLPFMPWRALFPGAPAFLPNLPYPFSMRRQPGFTLIELLAVCSILAAISYLAWGAYVDVDRRAEDELARAELLRLADALRRFHDDTGYWPGEGPWRLASVGGAVPDTAINADDIEGGNTATLNKDWFASPANMTLLYTRPALDASHPLAFLAQWNAGAHRGWNGPYLPLASRYWVDVWPDVGENAPNGGIKFANVPAFGTGPKFPPASAGYASCAATASSCFLGARSLPRPRVFHDGDHDGADDITGYNPVRHEFARHARPFFFLRDPARVVYLGADGRYGGTNTGDVCLPNVHDPEGDGADDSVICLATH